MATKKGTGKAAVGHDVPAQLPGQLSIDEALASLEEAAGMDHPDWTALESFNLGELCDVLVRADAGVMLRSADRGRAIAVGVFVAGRSQWTTCREQRELAAILEACCDRLVAIAGSAVAPGPSKRRSASRRGS